MVGPGSSDDWLALTELPLPVEEEPGLESIYCHALIIVNPR